MALSEYEKAQFENLTAGFTIQNTSILKKMEKKDKARVMYYVAVPSLDVILLVVACLALLYAVGGLIAGTPSQLMTGGAVTLLLVWASMSCRPPRGR